MDIIAIAIHPKKDFQHHDTWITKSHLEIHDAGIAAYSRKYLPQDILFPSNTKSTELARRRKTELPVNSLLTWNVKMNRRHEETPRLPEWTLQEATDGQPVNRREE